MALLPLLSHAFTGEPPSSRKLHQPSRFQLCDISPQIARSFASVCLIVRRGECIKSLMVQIGSCLHKAAAQQTEISQVMI